MIHSETVRLFGPAHIAWLSGIAVGAALLAWACRNGSLPARTARILLGCALAACELARLPSSGLHFPGRLPLELSNVSTWMGVVACFTLAPFAVEFVYFAGISAASVALLTPDMGTEWPTQFFLNHGGIIIAASALVFGRLAHLRLGAMWRAYALLWCYVAFASVFDWYFHTNYAYLRTKPRGWTLLSLMGPWPWYILTAGAVGLAMFCLLSIPLRKQGFVSQAFREGYMTASKTIGPRTFEIL